MRYWWVNQNQTYRHEVQGGYLWSPKRNANGARNPFYESMREVVPVCPPGNRASRNERLAATVRAKLPAAHAGGDRSGAVAGLRERIDGLAQDRRGLGRRMRRGARDGSKRISGKVSRAEVGRTSFTEIAAFSPL